MLTTLTEISKLGDLLKDISKQNVKFLSGFLLLFVVNWKRMKINSKTEKGMVRTGDYYNSLSMWYLVLKLRNDFYKR